MPGTEDLENLGGQTAEAHRPRAGRPTFGASDKQDVPFPVSGQTKRFGTRTFWRLIHFNLFQHFVARSK